MSHEASSSSTSQNAQGSTWTEPPWSGWIETTGDALLILEAARRGLIPRVTRRLVDSERKMITSGSVFVFDEDESGIKRWTDGFFWSPSRILGNFLLYRETEKRGAGHRSARSDRDHIEEPEKIVDNIKVEGQSLSRSKDETSRLGIDRQRERSLVGSLTNSYKFKPGGMMKKTFSLTIGGVAQHLISYYKIEDVEQGRLRSPSTLPELASLDISPEYLDKTHFRTPPKVEIGVDGIPRYRGEADDIDGSPQLIPAPLPSMSPYPEDASHSSSSKRNKRYDPYPSTTPAIKRTRKPKNPTHSPPEVQSEQPSTSYGTAATSPSPTYSDPSLSATTTPHYSAYPYYPVHSGYHLPAPVYTATQYSHAVAPISTSSHVSQHSQHSPTSPEHTPTSATVPHSPYGGYGSEGSQSSQQAVVYPYYASPGYGSYSAGWAPYSSYPPHPHSQHMSSGSSGAAEDQDGEGSPGDT